MKKTVGIIIAAVVGLVGLVLVLRRREAGFSTDPISGLDCISVPKDFIGWSGSFASTDWGAYGAARQQHLGIDPNDDGIRAFVDGFFKAIDVEPRSNYVKHFKREIRDYINSTSALPHWEVSQVGYMRCGG